MNMNRKIILYNACISRGKQNQQLQTRGYE